MRVKFQKDSGFQNVNEKFEMKWQFTKFLKLPYNIFKKK